ncbi:Plant peroxidase [Macleaya cordata]|uniref:Peroxidase n=1 Tax=Macleaya cordata TaxID=56857 RepID=A0A200QV69_MACCD|nr:Plant peroxidase [Macleaya cordata]
MGSLHLLLILLFSFSLTFIPSQSKLTTTYYDKSCPKFSDIVRETITNKQITNPTTAAGTLRLFFHDCIANGCDASILITSNSFNKAERDADINLSLPGDGFDVIVRAKTALELQCPGVVSCADILAVATRDLVTMVGGPFYPVRLGRKDGFVSKASDVEGHLPKPTMTMSQIISLFAAKGFSVEEMVALTGAHTIGFSHCKEFANRIYSYSKSSQVDPTLNPRFADGLKKACVNYESKTTVSVFNDIMTPNKFDNMYYQNLPRGLGLLASDRGLFGDARTKPFVERFAANQTVFFNSFAYAMEKLSRVGVKSGKKGEVRHRCDAFNSIRT